MDDGDPAQVEEVLALAAIAGTGTLPAANMRQGVFHRDALAQTGAPLRRVLAFAQFPEQVLVGVDADGAPLGAAGAAFPQGAIGTGLGGEVHRPTRDEWEADSVRAGQRLRGPIQDEGRLGEARPLPDGPGP